MNDLTTVLSDSPVIRALQIAILIAVLLDVYLVVYVVRDILLRSQSFAIQLLSIVLTGALPLLGFLIYLLVRPSRTLKEREMEELLHQLLDARKEERTAAKAPKHHVKTTHTHGKAAFQEAAV